MRSMMFVMALLGLMAAAHGQPLAQLCLVPGCASCAVSPLKCTSCDYGFYKNNDRCSMCPLLQWSGKGSDASDDCRCYLANRNDPTTCRICPVNTAPIKWAGACGVSKKSINTQYSLTSNPADNPCPIAEGKALVINYTPKEDAKVIVTAFESDFKGQLSVYEAADPIRSAQCVDSTAFAGGYLAGIGATTFKAGTRYVFVGTGVNNATGEARLSVVINFVQP